MATWGGAEIPLSPTTNTSKPQLTEQSATTPGEMYRSRVWEDLRELFQQDHLTDVMLAAEGRSIPCHKVLLAAASKFFCDKFITNPESLELNILDIDEIDFDTLASVVSFIYSGNIELTVEKIEKLMPTSVRLMLPELTKECKNFLGERHSDISDCVAVYKIAKANFLENAAQKAWQIMLDNFQDITITKAFKKLSETELMEYIRAEDLNVASEDQVFEAVVTWVRHDIDNRKDRFESLLEQVILPHCSVAFLSEIAMQEPLMESVDGLRRITAALVSQAKSPSLQLGIPRKVQHSSNSLIAIYNGREQNEYNLQCWVLKGGKSEWRNNKTSIRNMDMYPASYSICRVRDGILITGQNNCNKKLSLPTLVGTTVSNLNVARTQHASVCVDGQVYVLGGYSEQLRKSLQSVEYLHEKTGSWCLTTDMPVALCGHTAVSYKHYIYDFRGNVESQLSRASFGLDTVTKIWSRKADMPQFCVWGSSVVYRDKIYVLGGRERCLCPINLVTTSGSRSPDPGRMALVDMQWCGKTASCCL